MRADIVISVVPAPLKYIHFSISKSLSVFLCVPGASGSARLHLESLVAALLPVIVAPACANQSIVVRLCPRLTGGGVPPP